MAKFGLMRQNQKRKLTVVLLIITILLSCQNREQNVVGEYKWVDYTFFEKFILCLKRSSYLIGEELSVKPDSTFELKTCGNICTGTWKVEGDSLLLFYKTNKWRNDSLQLHGWYGEWPEIPKEPSKYYLEGDYLRKIYKSQGNSWFNKSTTKMKKIIKI